ncbi:HDIG domain-containing protein [Porphyromonadaceae bacterium W3.11]|nr:HDIG domain-containing protein [Porphyromonadaceae bacterium W3.11]
MKLHKSIIAKSLILFILAAVLVTISYPRKVKFIYDYAIDQPWRYEGVLTAPYNFPVYKSDAMRAAERDSVERSRIYYYKIQPDVRVKERNRLTEDFSKGKFPDALTSRYMKYLLRSMDEVYAKGILSIEAYDEASLLETSSLYLVDDKNVAKRRNLSEMLTARQAYELILDQLPKDMDEDVLKGIHLEAYLAVNLQLDEEKTNQMHNARLASLTDIIGSVQKGERIVGQGDMVTPEIYQELEAYKRAHEGVKNSSRDNALLFTGQFVIILILFMVLYIFFLVFRPDFLRNFKNVFFIVVQIATFTILTYVLVPIEPAVVYIIPYCTVPILVRIFFDTRTAGLTHLVMILLSALVVPSQMEFLLVQFVAGRSVIYTLKNLSQRSDLIRTSFTVFFTMLVTYNFYMLSNEGGAFRFDWILPIYFAINFVFLMFTYIMVYVIERTFGYVSNISLVEIADINKPLLRQLSEVAPGTFQHSLNVATIATEAVEEIGGDSRLIRAGALYHDIGKMRNPTYFTENQGAVNPHDQLDYDESARIIIRHVTDGIEMAEKHKLPQVLIDFIRTHHGLGMTKYFYIKYKNEHPDEIIDESVFRYPGPNPFTMEQGVLMLADAVEASSRSLKIINEQIISEHIDKIVDGIVNEGLLKDTPLTFKDIGTIKFIFNEKLRNMYHSRIDYPELKATDTSIVSEHSEK